MPPAAEQQIASAVLMIRPACFGANPETAASNTFQRADADVPQAQVLALREFDVLAGTLGKVGITVEIFEDTSQPATPDAVFPGNWLSLHADGSVCLYPMLAQNRRWERRSDIIDALRDTRGYQVGNVEDFTANELEGRYLEGTGSLVLDRVHRIAYACLSPRTDEKLLKDWAGKFGYEALAFHAVDNGERAVYHTDVMMNIGERLAMVCLSAVPETSERRRLQHRLEQTDHEIVPITPQQMNEFAGNALHLATRQGGSVLAMSMRAERSLTPTQREAVGKYTRIVTSPVNTIENLGGGSVRCMLAEIFLPRQTAGARL